MPKNILITGANAGLGKESARQFAMQDGAEKIYLGVRNLERGHAAKVELEESTGKFIFEVFLIDVSNITSAKQAAKNLKEPIDALVLNAGGIGGKTPLAKNRYGVMDIVAHNLIGHATLVDALIAEEKLAGVVIYAGSEAARGIKKFGIARPSLKTHSTEELQAVLNGSYFNEGPDPMTVYAYVKQVAALWMSAMARKYPRIRFVTVSPGGTTGTDAAKNANVMFKFLMRTAPGKALGRMLGLTHDLSEGAKRYVDVVNDESYKTGHFYASNDPKAAIGGLSDQAEFYDIFNNTQYQDNADNALHSFLSN